MNLTIAIPACNEEESIENIIRRTLEARGHMQSNSRVEKVHVVVVSDGSRDKTVELAKKYHGEIELVVFPRNRGYGAAIKEGWRQFDDELLGFLDADGTCDPLFFQNLCDAIIRENADIVLGSRTGPKTAMPWLRRLGNKIFSGLLSFFSSMKITDTASGMRVLRRSALQKLLPLPDGMNFTPAMSARAVLCGDLKIMEIAMDYHERVGKSKLKIFSDGICFLASIIEMAMLYCPSRGLNLMGALLFLAAGTLMALPVYHYATLGNIPDWMIYRFVISDLLLLFSSLIFSISHLAEKIIKNTFLPKDRRYIGGSWALSYVFNSPTVSVILTVLFIFGFSLILPSLYERVLYGKTYEHWSRYMAMLLLCTVPIIFWTTKILGYILNLNIERKNYLESKMSRDEIP